MPERKILRLKDYDYSSCGYYYITLLIKNRECHFGHVINEKMILNEYGAIAKECWEEIPKHFQNINLYEYIIMPNHMHGIIEISSPVSAPESVRVRHALPLQTQVQTDEENVQIQSRRQYHLLPCVIGSFKSAVTKKINELKKIHFQWYRSYYDHIIKDEEDLNRIREYIIYNPLKWNEDENNANSTGKKKRAKNEQF